MTYANTFSLKSLKSSDVLNEKGHFIPQKFYKIITTPTGRPSHTAINLLSEIYYWYQPSIFGYNKKFKHDLLSLRYSDLEEKFCKSKETLRRAFVTLENLGLVKRHFRQLKVKNMVCSNVMFVELNIKELAKHLDLNINFEQEKESQFVEEQPLKCGDINRENNNKNKANSLDIKNKFSFTEYEMKLATSFLPIPNHIAEEVRKITTKEFPDLYFENVLLKLLELDRKKQNKNDVKWSEKQVIARLIAWSNREYKSLNTILVELGLKSYDEVAQEKEDEDIIIRYENSISTHPVAIIKRKIATHLDKKSALFLLTKTIIFVFLKEKKLSIKLLSENPDDLVFLAQLKLSLEKIAKEVIHINAEIEFEEVEQIEHSVKEITLSDDEDTAKIQKALIERFGEKTYISWFSKVKFYEDTVNYEKNFYLCSENDFMSSYLRSNYLNHIEVVLLSLGFDYDNIYSITEKSYFHNVSLQEMEKNTLLL